MSDKINKTSNIYCKIPKFGTTFKSSFSGISNKY